MQDDTDRVWRGLCEFILEFGYPPSQRELAARLFFGATLVGKQLAILEARGVVELYGARRAVKLLKWHPALTPAAPALAPSNPPAPACFGCSCAGGGCDLETVREKLAAALEMLEGALARTET